MLLELTALRCLEIKLLPGNNSLLLNSTPHGVIAWVFVASIFVPIEVYLFGAFLRPVFIATLFVLLTGPILSAVDQRGFTVRLPPFSFFFPMLLLGFFILAQPLILSGYNLQIKELIEIAVTLACSTIFVTMVRRNGALKFLQSLCTVGILFVIGFLAHEIYVGDFPTFKDPYWIILVTSLSAFSLVYLRVEKFGAKQLFLLFVIILSASRTLWVCLIGFLMFAGSITLYATIGTLSLPVGFLMATVPQIEAYVESFVFTMNNANEVLEALESESSIGLANASDNVRLLESWRSFHVFSEHPIFGVGINNYQSYLLSNLGVSTHITAHNELLRVLAEGGFVLFAIYLMLYFFAFLRIKRLLGGKPRRIAFGFLAASFLLAFFTATNFTITLLLIISISFTFCPLWVNGRCIALQELTDSGRTVSLEQKGNKYE